MNLEVGCPYIVGNTIDIGLVGSADYYSPEFFPDDVSGTVTGTIVRIFEPFTWSCKMAVSLDTPVERLNLAEKDVVFLKVFDRRFSDRLRVEDEAQPWSVETERKYQRLILDMEHNDDPSGERLLRKLYYSKEQDGNDNDGSESGVAWMEASLAFSTREYFRNELEAYGCFNNSTKKSFPLIHSTYIDGFKLTDIVEHAPREAWQGICDAAVGIVVKYFHFLINEDISHRNFIVRKKEKKEKELKSGPEESNVSAHRDDVGGDYEVFMVDFALSKMEDNSGILFWDDEKSLYDEEGAVGYDMEEYLEGGYVYHRSRTYLDLDKKY